MSLQKVSSPENPVTKPVVFVSESRIRSDTTSIETKA